MSEDKKTILVVEDEHSLSSILREKLTDSGFSVIEARNGEEGLNKAKSQHPDLILLDIVMPVMDGLTMLEKLREDEWGKKVKVILLTNLSDEEKLDEAVNLGLSDYLIKADWTMADVVKKVKEKLKIQ